jgi:hypothetical protein
MAGFTPIYSHRQRADASSAARGDNLARAIAFLRDARATQTAAQQDGLQNELLQTQIGNAKTQGEANTLALQKDKQINDLGLALNDATQRAANPAIMGPVQPGEDMPTGVFTEKGIENQRQEWMRNQRAAVVAQVRTLKGEPTTAEDIAKEFAAKEAEQAAKTRDAESVYNLRTAQIAATKADEKKTLSESKKIEAEILAGNRPPPTNPLDLAKFAHQLHKDFLGNQQTQDYQVIERTTGQLHAVMSAAESKEKAGKKVEWGVVDQPLITLFNKLLDPSSVVRESEYARTPQNQAYIDDLRGRYAKYKEGGAGITPEFRAELLSVADTLAAAAEDGFKRYAAGEIKNAVTWGVTPTEVLGNYAELFADKKPAPTTSPAPAGDDPIGTTKKNSAGDTIKKTANGWVVVE